MKDAALKDFRFYKIMLPGFIEKLLLPCKFSALYMEIKGKRKTRAAVLACPNGKTWHVDIYEHMDKTYIGGEGWKKFAHSNDIKLGYFLLFHYEGNWKFNIKVFNLKLLEIDYTDISMENVESENEESNSAPTNEYGERRKSCSRFKITVDKRHLKGKRVFVRMPSCFIKSNGLEEFSEVTLRDPKGREWNVGLYHSFVSGVVSFARGWLAFARKNKLREGSKCIFKLRSKVNDKVVIRVKIRR